MLRLRTRSRVRSFAPQRYNLISIPTNIFCISPQMFVSLPVPQRCGVQNRINMLGEAWVAVHTAQQKLRELREQREMFALRGEDSLHPFVFEKKLRELDQLIARYEDDLYYWTSQYDELLSAEAADCGDDDRPADGEPPEDFDSIFRDLSRIEGVQDPNDDR